MKNTIITLTLIFTTFFNLPAQEIIEFKIDGKGYVDSWKECIQSGVNYIQSGSIDNKAVDLHLNWDKYTDALELSFGIDFDSNGYAIFDLGHCFGSRLNSYKLGLGLQERYVNGSVLFQAKCFPYLGVYGLKMGSGHGPKVKHGLCTQIEGGIKMLKINDAMSVFLTLGYEFDAPKFKVNKMFKEENGKWTCGLTFIM